MRTTVESVVYRRGRIEADRLTMALVRMASQGLRTPCSDAGTGGLWLSESEAERGEAVKLCSGCPVLPECREVGKYQTFGVFGAVDVTRRQGKTMPAA